MLSFFLFKGDGNSYYATTGYLNNIPHFLWVYLCDNPRGILGENEKACKSRALIQRRVIYKLFECSPNVPSGLSRR